MWVSIAYSGESKPEDAVQKLDIDVCDEQGNVCENDWLFRTGN